MNRWKPLISGSVFVALLSSICIWHRAHAIQESIHDRATAALQAAGIPPSSIAVVGRNIILTGFQGSREASPDAQAAVRGTWGVGEVSVKFRELPPAPKLSPAVLLENDLVLSIAKKPVEFEPGRTDLTMAGKTAIDGVRDRIARCASCEVSIEAHTSNEGDPAANLALSTRRAETVKKYLVSHGIDETRLAAQGFGGASPVADNSTAEGRARNSRIEFKVKERVNR